MRSLRIRTGWFHKTNRIPLEPGKRWASEPGCGFLPMVMSSCPAGLSSPWPVSQQALGLALSSLSSPAGLSVRVEPLWPSSAVQWTFKLQQCSGTVSSRNEASCWWQLLMRALMPHTNKVITRTSFPSVIQTEHFHLWWWQVWILQTAASTSVVLETQRWAEIRDPDKNLGSNPLPHPTEPWGPVEGGVGREKPQPLWLSHLWLCV